MDDLAYTCSPDPRGRFPAVHIVLASKTPCADLRRFLPLRSAEHPISNVGDDLEQLNALLSGEAPTHGFQGSYGGVLHRPTDRPGGASSASGSVTDDLEQLNALLTADDAAVRQPTPRGRRPCLKSSPQ